MSRGHDRERALKNMLQGDDWFAMRAPASLGVADLVVLKEGHRPMLIEVKSTTDGPYKSFGPQDRSELSLAAKMAGADAWLVWWPPRAKPVWIAEHEWPVDRRQS